jgi:hypothetical protein
MYNSTCVVDVSAGLQPACCGLKPAAGWLQAATHTITRNYGRNYAIRNYA